MRIASLIARILLGLLFTVFGLNGFLHFMPMGAPPTGVAGQYLGALFLSHYLSVVLGIELIAGILLLLNRYVPLALAVLAPILVNILLFHALMAPTGMPLAVFASILWIASVWNVRWAFARLLEPRVDSAEPRSSQLVRGGTSASASSAG